MRSYNLITAALAVTAGLAMCPVAAGAQSLGAGLTTNTGAALNGAGYVGGQIGGISGERQSGTAASVNADLSAAREARGHAADTARSDLRQARRDTGDAYNAARSAAGRNADARTHNLHGLIDRQANTSANIAVQADGDARQ